MNTNPLPPSRQYFVDWVRVIAFGLLIFFHCAMPFVRFGWEIKNDEHSFFLDLLIHWLHQWRIPLLFFIAGVGSNYSMAKRSAFSFLGERFVRLFIPLVFAMFFVLPVQVYFEKLQRGLYAGSYSEFYPLVWTFELVPKGAITWSHLWFVAYLFVFTLLMFPVFSFLKWGPIKRAKQKLNGAFSSPWVAGMLFLSLLVYHYTLFLDWPGNGSLTEDWFIFLLSITLFFYGYFLADLISFWETCEKYRWHFLTFAVLSVFWLYARFWWTFQLPEKQDSSLYEYGLFNSIHIWTIMLSALGFARKHLNFSNPFLHYTTPAVYPFYILHQTIIVCSGFYVVQWNALIFVKLVTLLSICFGGAFLIYHFLIRPFMLTRVLYGLKPKREAKSGASLL